MQTTVLEKYSHISKINTKHNFLSRIVLSVLLLLITPQIFGTANLDAKTAAVPLEMFVSLIGIILLTPIFLPEQQEEIKEVIEVRTTNMNSIYIVRIVIALLSMLVLVTGFVIYMKTNGCEFDLSILVFGTFAEGLFLGVIGLFSYGLSNNIAIGYMLPTIYFLLNMFSESKYFGKFYLFSMSKGSFGEKYWLFGFGIILLAIALFVKQKICKYIR